jgi:hypothetical protein
LSSRPYGFHREELRHIFDFSWAANAARNIENLRRPR